MMPALGPNEVERFRNAIARHLGLQFEDDKLPLLEDILRRRLSDESACESYLNRLDFDLTKDEAAALAKELTVSETYFFRNIEQFHALREVVLPARVEARRELKRLSFLSAGCATGEEAYTIAIQVLEQIADPSFRISIRAVDLNPIVIERAARARFRKWALRETPAEAQRRWFSGEDPEIVLDERVRNAVKFEVRNLSSDDGDLFRPEGYDVVFCRNVMMYFTPEKQQALISRITRSLLPGGFLFLGHAETLRGLSQDFHLRHTHQTFYYQLKAGAETVSVPPAFGSPSPSSMPPPELVSLVDSSASWVETIQRAAERIQALTRTPDDAEIPAKAPAPRWDLHLALDLLKRERFGEALELVQGLPPESAVDPDVLLLRAVLLTHSGALGTAEETCQRLLALDELNAGAHYVLALCREGAGDRRGAVDHDQVAVYLDPGFSMPRLHLGLLARRAGDRETGRRELGLALVLLQREDAARLLLFGGGFTRDALTLLCRTELVACGGQP